MPHVKAAFEWFDKNIDLLKVLSKGSRSLLYIGIRHDTSPWWYLDLCKRLGIERVSVLEIFPKNLGDFEVQCWSGKYGSDGGTIGTILGNACQIGDYVSPGEFDIIFFDHGPEHLDPQDFVLATQELKEHAGKLLLYSAPWGEWPQGEEDGNCHEVHRTVLTPELLTSVGMTSATVNQLGMGGEGELIAWHVTSGGALVTDDVVKKTYLCGACTAGRTEDCSGWCGVTYPR